MALRSLGVRAAHTAWQAALGAVSAQELVDAVPALDRFPGAKALLTLAIASALSAGKSWAGTKIGDPTSVKFDRLSRSKLRDFAAELDAQLLAKYDGALGVELAHPAEEDLHALDAPHGVNEAGETD